MGAGFAAGALLVAAFDAFACSLEPVDPNAPPETPEVRDARLQAQQAAYELSDQRRRWSEADHVFLAREVGYSELLDEMPPPKPRYSGSGRPAPPQPIPLVEVHMLGEGKTVVVLEPLKALKGATPPRRFELRDVSGWTSCGPLRQFDVFYKPGGGRFVVFLKGPYPTQDGVLDVIDVDRIVAPDIRTALVNASR